MSPKFSEPLVKAGWTVTVAQKKALDDEALARRYNSSSELVRDIFQAWLAEHHSAISSSSGAAK